MKAIKLKINIVNLLGMHNERKLYHIDDNIILNFLESPKTIPERTAMCKQNVERKKT